MSPSGGRTGPRRRTGHLDDLDQPTLAVLAREYFLAGHLIDRAGMPHVISEMGRDAMTAVAIGEWSGASPVYTRRMQEALGFGGTDVETIFKGMQLDIGAPPEFLDFRFEVIDSGHGRFHLDHCGALADVEPMGDDYVISMCHHVEDPTFDATAAATNPRARMRPVHRPPRVPADRSPVCEWLVDIDDDRDPIPFPAAATAMAATNAAVAVPDLAPRPPSHEPRSAGNGPRDDYSGPFDPDLRFEDFSAAALMTVCSEAALQGHLLAMAFGRAVAAQADVTPGVAGVRPEPMLRRQLIGVAGLTAGRIAAAMDAEGGLDGIAAMLERHPLFAPRGYVEASIVLGHERLVVQLDRCAATTESVPGWIGVLVDDGVDVVAAMAEAVDPHATVSRVEPGGGVAAWEIALGGHRAPQRNEVALARFSSGAEFVFERIGRRSARPSV